MAATPYDNSFMVVFCAGQEKDTKFFGNNQLLSIIYSAHESHETLMVLQNAIHRALREPLLQPEALKFDRPVLGEEEGRRV